MSIYTNNPLLRGEAHIRLLRIVPGSPTDQIKCIFSTFDIDAAPKYQALSYEWGPKSPSKLIYVIGQPTTIRLNLWNFLSKLRSHASHDYLWCDAICIYLDRYRTKCCRNLRFEPLFSEGFGFDAFWVSQGEALGATGCAGVRLWGPLGVIG
jgi:hypothetical protein